MRVTAALHVPAFRYFLTGSFLSNVGTWMQSVAQAWLVLELTNSAFFLGLDGFAASIPISIFTFWGGVLADRLDRRHTLLRLQWVALALAVVLGVLVQLHVINVWHILLISLGTGFVQAIAWPVYQSILASLVPRETLSNAIALNSAQFNLARMIGPVLGAMALHRLGAAGCFYVNALSFVAVIYALRHVPVSSQPVTDKPTRVWEAFKTGLAYYWERPVLYWLLILLAVVSVFGFPAITLLPVFARDLLGGGASGFGMLVGSFGTGAVIGGLAVAYMGDFPWKGTSVVLSYALFVAAMVGLALSHNMMAAMVSLSFVGFGMVTFVSVINTIIQSQVPDELRGRAMSVFVFSFGGFMPFGNLLAGMMARSFGAREAVGVQAGILFVVGLLAVYARPDIRRLS